jgi:hypothetical protein
MTIEIQELIIQARVTDGSPQPPTRGASLASLGRMEQDRLIEQITQRVLESLRDQRKQH